MKILVVLIIVSVVAGLKTFSIPKPEITITCEHPIHCPCGRTSKNVTVCMKVVKKYDPCSTWAKCKTCMDGLEGCLECPKGREGQLCSVESRRGHLFRQKRQVYGRPPQNSRFQRKPNQGYPMKPEQQGEGFCPDLQAPKFGSIRCVYSDRQRACTGRCLPGYNFEGRESENEITLTCTKGIYTPSTEFPRCKSGGYCDLIVQTSGSFNCTTGMDGTRCDVICKGRNTGRYLCYPGRDWEPSLPSCVQPKGVDVDRSCRCEYGGICDSNGNCVCPVGRTGRYCDTILADPNKQTCSDPGFIENGVRRNTAEESNVRRMFDEGESVAYSCSSEDYALQGSSLLTCQNDGTWSSPLPKCIKTTANPVRSIMFCKDPGMDSNGRRKPQTASNREGFPQGTLLEYSCNQGYDLDGEANIFCLTSGEWSSGRPGCNSKSRDSEVRFCRDLGVDPNGSRNPRLPSNLRRFPQGTHFVYSCNPGYDMVGAKNVYCLTSGEWSSERPKCYSQTRGTGAVEIAYCLNPGSFLNGRTVYYAPLNSRQSIQPENTLYEPEYPEGGRVQYICNSGYTLEGTGSLTCQASGEWSADPPVCKRAPNTINYCSDPKPIPNGKAVHVPSINERVRDSSVPNEDSKQYPEGSRLQYSCDNGYVLEGTSSITCKASGEWSSDRPTCRTSNVNNMMNCLNPGSIWNGRINYQLPGDVSNTGSNPSENMPEYPEGTKIEYHCDDGFGLEGASSITCESSGFWSEIPPNCVSDCGRSAIGTDRKVLHGNRTTVGEWPWIVAIGVEEDNYSRVICGGAVLNTQTVITAAHCLVGASKFTLYFGKYYRLHSLDDEHVVVRTSERLIIHPDYDNETMDSDIALITFMPKIQFSDRIRPICLPTGESTALNLQIGKRGYVTGWGDTEKRRASNVLLLAHLPFVTNGACLQSFRENVPNFTPLLTQNMFCAGFSDTRQTTCKGDSGSPLFFYNADTQRYILEGLVSFSVEGQCGMPGRYSVFTKVNMFLPWIYRNMQIN